MNAQQLWVAQANGLSGLGADVNDVWGDIFGAPKLPTTTAGSSAPWWQQIIQPISQFGNTFLLAKYGKDAAKFGAGPFAQQGAYGVPAGMTADQYAQYVAQYGGAPGSVVSSGLSSAWASLANTVGVQPGTLTMLALAGGVLLFMSPPRGRR